MSHNDTTHFPQKKSHKRRRKTTNMVELSEVHAHMSDSETSEVRGYKKVQRDNIVLRATYNLASSECFEIGPHLNEFQFRERPGSSKEDTCMTTWLPKYRTNCRVSMLEDGKTVILIEDKFYYTSPMIMLHPGCPSNVVFHCHYTEDTVTGQVKGNDNGGEENVIQPRLLVYDMHYTDSDTQPPFQERYSSLRTHMAPYFKNTVAVIQWVGHHIAARKLLVKDPGFGHEIEGLVFLTDTPGELVRPLHVQIPDRYITQFKQR